MGNHVVKVEKGTGGWGGPLYLQETESKKVIASVTGGGIHPVAKKIAELLNVPAVDGFKEKVEPDEMICVVVDCGGTARCGVYPKLGVLTIDLHPITPSGPLGKYINDKNFVSGVGLDQILLSKNGVLENDASPTPSSAAEAVPKLEPEEPKVGGLIGVISGIGRGVGKVVGVFYQAGRDTIEIVIKNILPFMAFVCMIVGFINFTGLGSIIAQWVSPLAGNIVGLLILSLICAIPFLSPILGPGGVIASVVGVLLGQQIAAGAIPPAMALPALFAINAQVGGDFVPVGLTLAEAEPYTVEIGVPAVLFSRLLTGPAAVLLAWIFSIGLY